MGFVVLIYGILASDSNHAFPEAVEGSRLAGADQSISPWLLDIGPWDHELCEKTVSGSLYLPFGPWATGVLDGL